ncbi:MAG: hypothetical protein IPJ13_26040 [Saprospiraceae bacterium]|nr:hypothetical protein [Saprospiraceae bacterium]
MGNPLKASIHAKGCSQAISSFVEQVIKIFLAVTHRAVSFVKSNVGKPSCSSNRRRKVAWSKAESALANR